MDKTPKQEAEDLMNELVPLAKTMLKEHGEFYPYGAGLKGDGSIVHIGAKIKGVDKPESKPLIDILRKDFRWAAKEGVYKAVGVVFNVVVPLPGTNEKSDAIQICLDHLSGYSAEVFFPYKRLPGGRMEYGRVFAQNGDGLIFDSSGSQSPQ
jgi:hypothetical protein